MIYKIKRKINNQDVISYDSPKVLSEIIYNPLLEKLLDLEKDINYIYNIGFKDLVNSIEKGNLVRVPDTIRISSNTLELSLCEKANLIKPIFIFCGIISTGSQYYYIQNYINISINPKIMSVLGVNGFNLEKTAKDLGITMEAIKNEYSESAIKSSIAHELSHWVRDTLYKNELTTYFLSIQDNAIRTRYKSLTHFEIDAQVHAIKQIKLYYKDEWDEMKLSDVFKKYTALYAIILKFYNTGSIKVLEDWFKKIVKRMIREDLLGVSMRMKDLDEFFSWE